MTSRPRLLAAAFVLLALSVVSPGNAASQSGRRTRDRIIGAWQLESREVRKAGGEVVRDAVLGAEPVGRLIYDVTGHMSLQMMRLDRKQAISTPTNRQDAQNARVILGYDSYFGTFHVDEAAGTVIHKVVGSLFPEDIGKDFVRQLTVDGNRLTLGFTSKSSEGFDVTRTLVFGRLR